jgi:hypothetical protein
MYLCKKIKYTSSAINLNFVNMFYWYIAEILIPLGFENFYINC